MIRYSIYADMMDELVNRRPDFKGCRYVEHGWKSLPVEVQQTVIQNARAALMDLDLGREPAALPPLRTPDQPALEPEGGAW